MTVTYDRDDDKRRLIIRLAGPFELSAALTLVAHIAADTAWSYRILYDTHELTGAPTMIELQAIIDRVQILAARKPRGPIAIVSPDPTVYGMAQMYSSRLDGKVDVTAFRTLDEARAWLDDPV